MGITEWIITVLDNAKKVYCRHFKSTISSHYFKLVFHKKTEKEEEKCLSLFQCPVLVSIAVGLKYLLRHGNPVNSIGEEKEHLNTSHNTLHSQKFGDA